MQLTKNVYIETGFMGANVGFVTTDEGIVMIETPQFPSDAVKWREKILSTGTLKYLINTESHGDHIMGDFFFDAPLVCHEKTMEAIMSTDLAFMMDRIKMEDPEGFKLIQNYKIKRPSITFSDRMTIHMGSHRFILINLPGHTEGETAVYIPEEKVVFTGDNINYQVPAFMHECVPLQWVDSIDAVNSLNVDHIVPGHGEVCNRSYLGEWREFILEWIGTVLDAIDNGWSKEEAIEKINMPSRFIMPPGAPEDMAAMLCRMNVSRLYDQLI